MYRNFLRVASANIKTKLLNVQENTNEILKYLEYAGKNDVDLLLFPELTLTGVSSGELIATKEIVEKCKNSLEKVLKKSEGFNTLLVFGMPIKTQNKFYNCMIFVQNGSIVNILGKSNLTYEEMKYFSPIQPDAYFTFKNDLNDPDNIYDTWSIYDTNIIANNEKEINIQLIFENDLLENKSHILNSSNIVLVPGSLITNINKLENLATLLKSSSSINNNAIIYAGASNYESSTSGTYASQKYIVENGQVIEEGRVFNNGMIITELNIDEIQKLNTDNIPNYYGYSYDFNQKEISLRRKLNPYPYFPNNMEDGLKNILEIQSEALARRLRQIPDNKIFIGISGGLDSTLGLIVASYAYHKLGLDSKNIFTITMPGLGTSDRTKNNATNLAKAYNTTFKEINIVDSVKQHFKDIEHDENDFSVTYENSQARERTQVLMDLANKHGGIVLGTGNMSEIALGWATFNGDHMAMYNVNGGIPKTLLREVVGYVANSTNNDLLKETLLDIIGTPISPELLPANHDGTIAQKTEDNVGPYELHDFFIYHFIRNKSKIDDIRFMTKEAFADKYSQEEIDKWLSKFLWRFSTQQFKRNTSVDCPQVLDYSLNSKNGFVMPSDIDPNSLKL